MSLHPVRAAALAVAVLLLASCSTSGSSETATSVPASESTPTPTARASTPATIAPVVDPVLPFDGDCSSVLSPAQLDELVGPGWADSATRLREWAPESAPTPAVSAIATLGGVECEWFVGERAEGLPEGLGSIAVVLLPSESAPVTAGFAEPTCEPSYDATLCRLARSTAGYWIMARAGWALQSAPVELLDATVAAAARNVATAGKAARADVTQAWWGTQDCAELTEAMRMSDVVGPYVNGYWEGSPSPETRLLAAAGVETSCPWFTDTSAIDPSSEFYLGSIVVAPGAGGQWSRLLAAEGVTAVPIDGAEEGAVWESRGSTQMFATDGVNIITIKIGAPRAVAAELAARAIGVLADG